MNNNNNNNIHFTQEDHVYLYYKGNDIPQTRCNNNNELGHNSFFECALESICHDPCVPPVLTEEKQKRRMKIGHLESLRESSRRFKQKQKRLEKETAVVNKSLRDRLDIIDGVIMPYCYILKMHKKSLEAIQIIRDKFTALEEDLADSQKLVDDLLTVRQQINERDIRALKSKTRHFKFLANLKSEIASADFEALKSSIVTKINPHVSRTNQRIRILEDLLECVRLNEVVQKPCGFSSC
ncbi:unnamed protein product [Caenorhabditis bovis]|uniref:Uncharacterized protein n=1 Tax=Caenorhabditis bovis TaxID=2654633 RepID=A0A8S1F0M9_9PELO|nr:unnamed protein product [Caenorhabditis bovis]